MVKDHISTHNSWSTMIQRCSNPNNPGYPFYGGRGICVCTRWKIFANFLKDMGDRPKGKQLERIDNEGDYEPKNCRWATHLEQCHNFRKNVRITVGKETMCLAEWAAKLGVHPENLRRWYHSGIWPQNFEYRGLWNKRTTIQFRLVNR